MQQRSWLLTCAITAATATGCGGVKMSGAPVAAAGVTIALDGEATFNDGELSADAVVTNELDEPIGIALHQIAVVAADGVPKFERQPRAVTVAAKSSRTISLDREWGLNKSKASSGFYVSFGGIYVNDENAGLPVMVVGKPSHELGELQVFARAGEKPAGGHRGGGASAPSVGAVAGSVKGAGRSAAGAVGEEPPPQGSPEADAAEATDAIRDAADEVSEAAPSP